MCSELIPKTIELIQLFNGTFLVQIYFKGA